MPKIYKRYGFYTPPALQDPDTTAWIPELEGNFDYQRVLAEVAGGQATIEEQQAPTPIPPPPVQLLRQTTFDEIAVDTTTTSLTPVELLSRTLTTYGGALYIQFTCAMSLTQANADSSFVVRVDGVDKRGAVVAPSGANKGGCASVLLRVPVSADSHTVAVYWCVTAGTGRIRPVTAPTTEHASLRVQEVVE